MYNQLLRGLLVLAGSVTLFSGSAHALCGPVEEEGSWVSHPTRGIIAEMEIGFLCQDQIINGQPYPEGDPHTIHAFGDCFPTNCDWGELAADHDGTWHSTTYEFGFVTKTVYAKMSSYYDDELYVWIYSDFHDGRADGSDSGYMIRRESSCIDDCGGMAIDGCWCDDACVLYGDCCVDAEAVCAI